MVARRERIRLVFETARPHANQRRKPKPDRPRQQRKQQHRRHNPAGAGRGKTRVILKPECAIKPLLTRQPGDHREAY